MGKDDLDGGPRSQTTIEIVPEMMAEFDDYIRRKGGRGLKKTALSRLVEWFVSLPDSVKSGLIGWTDDDVLLTQAKVLREFAGQLEDRAKANAARSITGIRSTATDLPARKAAKHTSDDKGKK